MYKYLLFDLDGTISDSSLGITKCVQLALEYFDIHESRENLKKFIGPPLKYSFMKHYNFTDEQTEKGIEIYRGEYSKSGKFENEIYAGMDSLLHDLKKDGRVLLLASSKPKVFVEDILKHFGVKECFDIISGSELDGSKANKLDIIKDCLIKQFNCIPDDLSECVMIGDTKFDLEAANQLNLPTIAVSYGFGSLDDFKALNAGNICNTVDDLRSVLFS